MANTARENGAAKGLDANVIFHVLQFKISVIIIAVVTTFQLIHTMVVTVLRDLLEFRPFYLVFFKLI
jgi:hypothetical protein